MNKCRVISRYGIGVDNVAVDAATANNIPVCNVRHYCDEEVPEHALALLLTCARRTAMRDGQVRRGAWDVGSDEPLYRIAGKVLGLVGYGALPRGLHRKVSGLGLAEILIYDPYVSDDDAAKAGVRKVPLDELCRTADYISVHAPLNDETRHMIGREEFEAMKPTAILVNTARGAVVDTDALVGALKGGLIAAAGIDVYEPEPPPKDSPLFDLPNVVLTDHTAWYSEESQLALQTGAAKNVALVLSGEPPLFCVNPEVVKFSGQ
jgi:D-3-phosphoglycerate dehydrogenase